ncbi:MAG: glycosyltransferase family 2 protein [Acidimicrobiia bacterium]|nr:glycosyltransferase family 2 protein [Acidimicrobiia bacterium]
MNFVIPMAGHGRRFIEKGHALPKFLLEAHGKTLLEWSVDSLPLELATLTTFVMLREHEVAHRMEARIHEVYGDRTPLAFVLLDEVTRGQAETVLLASSFIEPERPLVIFNIDTMFHSPTLKTSLQRDDVDGVLGCFRSQESRFSFAAIDSEGLITRVAEKEPISEYALTGLYHFHRAADFLDGAAVAISQNQLTKGEFYVAPLYNQLLARNARLILDYAPIHHILGTPLEYAEFAARPLGAFML